MNGQNTATVSFSKSTWLLSSAVIVAMLFPTFVMFQSGLFSPRFFSLDTNLMLAFAGILIVIVVLCSVQQGRLLASLSFLSLITFLAFNIIGQHTAMVWALLGWILIISAGLGNIIICNLLRGPAKLTPIERFTFFVSTGLGEIALMIMALGLLHLLYQTILIATLFVLSLPAIVLSIRNAQTLKQSYLRWKQKWEFSDLTFFSVAFSLLLICLFGGLVWALAPNISHDPLRYHLGVPQIYVQQHAIVDVPEEFRSYWAHNAEMLYTLALLLTGQPLPSLIHLIFGLLTTALLFAFGRRIEGSRVGIITAILFVSLPLVTWESGLADNDLVVTFYSLAAAYSALAWWQESDDAWLPLIGIFSGFAAGTKLNAILVLIPLFVLLASALVIRYKRSRGTVVVLRILLIAMIPTAPWLIRDWLWSGNPVFPYLNGIFQSPSWPHENTLLNFSRYGVGHGFTHLLRLPWDLTVHTSAYMEEAVTGFAGALPMLALPWMYLLHFKRERRLLLSMLAGTALGTVLWFAIGQHLRYLLALFPFFALFSALNLEAIWIVISRQFAHRQLPAVLLLIPFLSYIAATRLIHAQWTSLPERYPIGVALGLETPQSFLSRALPVYNALHFLDEQNDGTHKVLSVGNFARVYTRARIFGVPTSSCGECDIQKLTNEQDNIKQQGFDFLLVNRAFLRDHTDLKPSFSQFQKTFVTHFGDLQFSSHGVYVYRLLDHELQDSLAPRINLISNSGFEEADPHAKPLTWEVYGSTVVDRSGSRSHSQRAAIDSRGAWLLQRLPVQPGSLYTLGSWIRSDQPNPSVRLQIEWFDHDSKLLDIDFSVDGMDISRAWQWNEISATAPSSATIARVGARVDAGSNVWFDDFLFEQKPNVR